MRSLLLLAAAVALSACSPPPPRPAPGTTAAISDAAEPSLAPDPHSPRIENDPYSISIDITTDSATRRSGDLSQVYNLLSKTHRKGDVTLVYVQWSAIYTARTWRFYNRASNDKGQSYDFRQVNRDVAGCPSSRCVYNETYNIIIPPADLRRGATEGIRFKIYARNGGDVLVEIPASLVAQFNEKLAEVRKMRAGS